MFRFKIDELLKKKSKKTGEDVTLYQLARDTKMSNTQAYRLNKPMKQISSKTVAVLADYFGVKPEDTFEIVQGE